MKIVLFQSLQNRNNNQYVEQNGPFKCTNKKAWLGFGYYFWDTFIELAHWWGEVSLANNYLVVRAEGHLDDSCFDLVGNNSHLQVFKEICDSLRHENYPIEQITVPNVIELLKKKDFFSFKAIRAAAHNSIRASISKKYRIKYISKSEAYLNLLPQNQICLLEKNALNLANYKIVFPVKEEETYFV